jgi:hypothetical protein
MTDIQQAERETDDLIDEWHNRLPPLTQAEIMATIHRVAEQMDQWQNELLGQSRPDSD